MTTTTAIHLPTKLDPVASALDIAPALRSRAVETESLRTLPADLVDTAERLGLTSLLLPRALGGLETDPLSVMTTIETLAHADGSAGWSLMISNATFFLAWLDPAVARDLLPGRPFSAASAFGPLGRGIPAEGGYRLSGQWPFCSASPHAEMFMNGMFVFEGDSPRLNASGEPDWQFAVFSKEDAEVLDTWDALGLRGSGSHDLRTTNTFVAEELTFSPFDASARHDGPIWRFSFWGLITIVMAALPLGIARHAMDELVEIAPAKRRRRAADTIAASPEVQVAVGHAEARMQAARSYLFDTVGEAWDTACNGDEPQPEQLARMPTSS